jgi:hypothetical protein
MRAERAMRRLPALLALLGIAAFLSACGGGGGSSGSSGNSTASGAAATPPTSSSSAATAGATGTKPTGSPRGHSKSEAAKRAAYEKKRYGSPSPQSAPFSKYSGQSSAKGQPALHLAEFGKEAAEARRREAGGVIEEYLQAKGAGEWEKACAYLAADVKAQAEGLAKAQGTEGGCGPALAMIVKTFGGDNRAGPLQASQGIASLRVQEGGRSGEGAGFALFHGSDGADYWMAVKREGGAWKVLSPAPQPLR